MSIKDDIFKVLITSLLSLIVYIGVGVLNNQKDISARLRIVEINQARIMERMDIKPMTSNSDIIRQMSKNLPP